ncbi:hypothetical protein [Domibacillus iocasae]|uniref:Uncharacterized protein n=1 Tax=Domibacillus iocasae TaxID=1714016 RepID=A0A1E7DRD1_9BACI|nr:hypothetical protein [Domibacillus iocasae]OES45624.1 hypothetical protein BA724_02095 [Domibacillus iocasae]
MDAYWAERIEGKRSAHVKKAEQDDALRFSKNIERKGNVLSLTRPNKQQYERYVKQGLTEQDIINRYRYPQ